MDRNPASKLSVFYNGIIVANIVLLVVFLLVLSYMQYSTFRKNQLDLAEKKLMERSRALDGVLYSAASHVTEMKIWAEDYQRMVEGEAAPSPLWPILLRGQSGDYFSLDAEPPTPEDAYGNLFGVGKVTEVAPERAKELNMALWLVEMMKINHRTTPYFAWSFYFSKEYFAASYPWVSLDFMLGRNPSGRLEDVLEYSYKGDNWGVLTPEKNPGRENLWLSVYVDNSGMGLVTTNSSPVYRGDEFIGTVAADIQLTFLTRFTSEGGISRGMAAVVNDFGQVVSHTGFSADGLERVPLVEDVLPEGTGEIVGRVIREKKLVFSKLKDDNLIVIPLEAAPWVLAQAIPERSIFTAFLPTVRYYELILLALAVFLGVVHFLIRENFVRPAISFVDFIHAEMARGPAPVPKVPVQWVRWFRAISDAMPFKAVSANLPGAIYQFVRHGDGRMEMSFVSVGIKDLTGIEPENIVGAENFREDLIPGPLFKKMLEELDRSEKEMAPFLFETPVRAADGADKWIRFIARPRRGEDGDMVWDGVALDVTDRMRAEQELKKHRDHLEDLVEERTRELEKASEELGALSRRVISSHEEERSRLSRELHDGFGQQLAAALFKITALRGKRSPVFEDIYEIENMVKDMTADLRGICRGLSPVTLDRLGLESAIGMIVDDLKEKGEIEVSVEIEKLDCSLDEDIEVSIFRVCQESVTNILKYAGAKRVEIKLYRDSENIALELVDDGCGFDRESCTGRGLGISGMKQRARLCGGSLDVFSAPGDGTRVVLVVPIDAKRRESRWSG